MIACYSIKTVLCMRSGKIFKQITPENRAKFAVNNIPQQKNSIRLHFPEDPGEFFYASFPDDTSQMNI